MSGRKVWCLYWSAGPLFVINHILNLSSILGLAVVSTIKMAHLSLLLTVTLTYYFFSPFPWHFILGLIPWSHCGLNKDWTSLLFLILTFYCFSPFPWTLFLASYLGLSVVLKRLNIITFSHYHSHLSLVLALSLELYSGPHTLVSLWSHQRLRGCLHHWTSVTTEEHNQWSPL